MQFFGLQKVGRINLSSNHSYRESKSLATCKGSPCMSPGFRSVCVYKSSQHCFNCLPHFSLRPTFVEIDKVYDSTQLVQFLPSWPPRNCILLGAHKYNCFGKSIGGRVRVYRLLPCHPRSRVTWNIILSSVEGNLVIGGHSPKFT